MFSWIISGQGETESSVHNFALKFIFRLPATIAITIIMFARIILLKGYPTSTLPNRPNVYVNRSGFRRQIGNLWPNIRGFCNSKHFPRIRVNCIKFQFEVKGGNVYSRDLISDSIHIWHSKRELNYVNSFALTWEVDPGTCKEPTSNGSFCEYKSHSWRWKASIMYVDEKHFATLLKYLLFKSITQH